MECSIFSHVFLWISHWNVDGSGISIASHGYDDTRKRLLPGPPAEACGGKEGRPEQVVLTPSDVMGYIIWYPLVMTNIANWKITMFNG